MNQHKGDQARCFAERRTVLSKINNILMDYSHHVNGLREEEEPGDWSDVASLRKALELLGESGRYLMSIKPKN